MTVIPGSSESEIPTMNRRARQALSVAAATAALMIAPTAPAAHAQQSSWRRQACSAFTTRMNARDWAWIDRHSSNQAEAAMKKYRSYQRARPYSTDNLGTNQVECEYYNGPNINAVRRSSGFVYANAAYWED